MLISRQELTSKGKKIFDENIVFDPELYKNNILIIDLGPIKVHVETEYVTNLTLVNVHLQGDLKLRSTRSLQEVDYHLDVKDDFVLAYDKEDVLDDNIILFSDNELILDDYLLSLITASLPLKIVKEDEEESFSGKGWEVISEEEYYSRKKDVEVENSPFAALKDLNLED